MSNADDEAHHVSCREVATLLETYEVCVFDGYGAYLDPARVSDERLAQLMSAEIGFEIEIMTVSTHNVYEATVSVSRIDNIEAMARALEEAP